MTRSLGAAPSIPHPHAVYRKRARGAADPQVRGGEAAPNDWLIAWCALANRIVEWQEACEAKTAETAALVFDSNDQARLA